MVSKLMPSAPKSRIAISMRQATSLSVIPTVMLGHTASIAASEASMALCSKANSRWSLNTRPSSGISAVAIMETWLRALSSLTAPTKLL